VANAAYLQAFGAEGNARHVRPLDVIRKALPVVQAPTSVLRDRAGSAPLSPRHLPQSGMVLTTNVGGRNAETALQSVAKELYGRFGSAA